jgi:hypothetical protein
MPAFVTRIQNYNHVSLFYLMVLKWTGYSTMHEMNVEALVSYLVLSTYCPGKWQNSYNLHCRHRQEASFR